MAPSKTNPAVKCSECGGTMELGFLLNGRYQGQWMKGPHEKGVLTSTVLRGKERRLVESWRCAQCGYLKSYAREVAK